MRVLIVEGEPLMAEAIRDGLCLEAVAADIAGDTALELLSAANRHHARLARGRQRARRDSNPQPSDP
jgi:two-component system response regulator VanR